MKNHATDPLIALRGLCKTYPSADGQIKALDEVSLSVAAGEIYGIVGMSGAGKSTLIRCLNRLDLPTAGDILYKGESVLSMDEKALIAYRRKVTMIFQQFHLFMQRTVERNVRYPLELAKVPKAKAEKRVAELLALVGLQDKAKAYPAQLSGGQKQRVAIARALASDPEVLLCDEATSALDPMTTRAILSLLSDIHRRLGITIILITHEMAVIRQICTRVAILDEGRVAEEGPVDEVFLHTRSEAGKRLFGILPSEADEDPGIPALRIVFDGAARERPIISQLIRAHDVPINILGANMKHLGGKMYGQMLIQVPDTPEETKLICDYLSREGLSVKEVNTR